MFDLNTDILIHDSVQAYVLYVDCQLDMLVKITKSNNRYGVLTYTNRMLTIQSQWIEVFTRIMDRRYENPLDPKPVKITA